MVLEIVIDGLKALVKKGKMAARREYLCQLCNICKIDFSVRKQPLFMNVIIPAFSQFLHDTSAQSAIFLFELAVYFLELLFVSDNSLTTVPVVLGLVRRVKLLLLREQLPFLFLGQFLKLEYFADG